MNISIVSTEAGFQAIPPVAFEDGFYPFADGTCFPKDFRSLHRIMPRPPAHPQP